MVWNKMKLKLEGFLSPALSGIVEYRASGYRYTTKKAANCYLTVNKIEIFNMNDLSTDIRWYQTEQEFKKDDSLMLSISDDELDVIRKKSGDKIPEERLEVIAKGHKLSQYAKDALLAQSNLCKTDFQLKANLFLTSSIDKSLESDDIIFNVLAIIDRRVGKKRLINMKNIMQMKHPIVRYFYELRLI
jgi:hypothetical protein